MSGKLHWYWHRFRAMTPAEVRRHCLKKLRQLADRRRLPAWPDPGLASLTLPGFPRLPDPGTMPNTLRDALRRDAGEILAGRWKAFGHLEMRVDDPPRWHRDPLVGIDLTSEESAFRLDHRQLPGGADIKLIWEPSRWYQAVRLAQAAWALDDTRAADTCRRWLADWMQQNRPYRGLNWTSALEAGMRLVQFTWIDALLSSAGQAEAGWREVRAGILPAHVWYTWRHRSFGSSANNHLLGELAGLILAIVRWPALARLAVPLEKLQATWEQEVLRQFAPDGGNREQALGYHLFSWEFCWQTRAALQGARRTISREVTQRLTQAGSFYSRLKLDEWDYGDSDNAFVTPFFADEGRAAEEWRNWFERPEASPALQFWWGSLAEAGTQSTSGTSHETREEHEAVVSGWRVFSDSGYGLFECAAWKLRWDLSPLGYLATAAHGHLDALHLSLMHLGVSFLIDPGTGAYYAEPALRAYLASWRAHNGPHAVTASSPERRGIFLWGVAHARPTWQPEGSTALSAALDLPAGRARRVVRQLERGEGWEVADAFEPAEAGHAIEFAVHWQFAPGTRLEQFADRRFRVVRRGVGLRVECAPGWTEVRRVGLDEIDRNCVGHRLADLGSTPLETVCSPAFRRLETGPGLWLTGRGDRVTECRTRFLAETTAA